MTIKTKLICNALLTLAGIAIIGGVSLLGMKFVQGKLFILTERSTPFQLKTIEMQRSLQEHTANLSEVSFAASVNTLAGARANAERTLADLHKVGGELAALKGKEGDGGAEEVGRLEELTRDTFATTQARLKAEEEARRADLAMKSELQDITRKLSELDASIQKRQKSSARQLSASSDSASDITQKLMSLTTARDFLKDANFALSELLKAGGKKGVIIARGKLDAALNEFGKNRLVLAGDPSVKVPAELAAEARKLVAAPRGLLELKGAALAKGGDAPPEYDQLAQSVAAKLSGAVIEIEQSVTLATGKYNQESRSHDDSLKGSNAAGEILALNGTLTSLGLDVKSGIRELFAARTGEEIGQVTAELQARFAAAEGIERRMAAALAASKSSAELSVLRGVGGRLSTIKTQLLAKDGVVDKLKQVVQVRAQAAALNLKLKELVARQNEQGKKGVTAAQGEQEKAVASVNRMVRSFVLVVGGVGLAMMIFLLATSVLLVRSITAPVRELVVLAEGFGNGNFSRQLDAGRKDEFGELARHFNQATGKLGEITGALTGAIARLAEHSRHLSVTAEELARGALEQAQATEQSAAAMTEISQSINEVAGSAAQAADASQQVLQTAGEGGEMVAHTARGMEEIAASVREAAALVHNLGERSEQVGSIVDIIKDIADQTALLALNASIEAARAGEMGMGFAVVADEVRKLAARTTEATAEIAAMIREIQDGTARTVHAMESGNSNVAEGVRRAGEASQSLEAILAVSNRGAEMAERIAAAAEEQSTAIVQISANVDGMAEITRRAEGATKEVRRASVELQQIADELYGMAGWFRGSSAQAR